MRNVKRERSAIRSHVSRHHVYVYPIIPGKFRPCVIFPISALEMSFAWVSA
jgi:hypothetical protein